MCQDRHIAKIIHYKGLGLQASFDLCLLVLGVAVIEKETAERSAILAYILNINIYIYVIVCIADVNKNISENGIATKNKE